MRTIKLFATLRDFVGAKEITVPFEEGGTARDLIQAVRQINPGLGDKIADHDGQMSGLVHIFVEGRNIDWLQGLDTVITDKDEVFMIPPVAGG